LTDDELVERLVQAASEAIRNERPAIVHDRARLRGIHLELNVANGGGAIRGEVYTQRSVNLRKLLEPGPPVPVGQEG
jgi:hypothetical protein